MLSYGDWGLGIGDWAQSPIPNPQSPFDSKKKFKKILKIKYLLIFISLLFSILDLKYLKSPPRRGIEPRSPA